MQTESTEKETLTCSDSQINHTIEQKIKLFIEQSMAVTPDATVPLSVARQKNKEKKNTNTKKCCSFQFKHLNVAPAELGKNKAAHLSPFCSHFFLFSQSARATFSHNAAPSVTGVAGLWSITVTGVFCIRTAESVFTFCTCEA